MPGWHGLGRHSAASAVIPATQGDFELLATARRSKLEAKIRIKVQYNHFCLILKVKIAINNCSRTAFYEETLNRFQRG
jgi:hypothetical protein